MTAELRAELYEIKKELIKQIKRLDKEIKSQQKTAVVEPVAESKHSVVITGNNVANRRIQTKLNLLRKIVNHLGK